MYDFDDFLIELALMSEDESILSDLLIEILIEA